MTVCEGVMGPLAAAAGQLVNSQVAADQRVSSLVSQHGGVMEPNDGLHTVTAVHIQPDICVSASCSAVHMAWTTVNTVDMLQMHRTLIFSYFTQQTFRLPVHCWG